MNPAARAAHLARARQAAREAREKRHGAMPRCTIPVSSPPVARLGRGGFVAKPTAPRPCGTRTVQNEPERSRGVYWCPRCGRYPWGNGGGRSGGGPDKPPPEVLS